MNAERIVLDWIRDVAPVAAKFAIMPKHVKALIEAIDAHLAEERAQMLTWSTQAIENHKLAETHRQLHSEAIRENVALGERAEAAEALALKLSDALELSQTSIRQLRDQGAPCAYWNDVEEANNSALSDERLAKLREKKNG